MPFCFVAVIMPQIVITNSVITNSDYETHQSFIAYSKEHGLNSYEGLKNLLDMKVSVRCKLSLVNCYPRKVRYS